MSKFHVMPQGAFAIARGLAAVAKEAGGHPVDIHVATGLPQLSLKTSGPGETIAQLAAFKAFLQDVGERTELPCTNATLTFKQEPTGTLQYKDDDKGTYFEITALQDKQTGLRFYDSLRKEFNLVTRGAVLGASLPDDAKEMLRFREEAVTSLESHVARLGVFLTDMAKQNAETVQSLTSDLQRQFQDKQAAADERMRKQQEDLDSQRKAFEQAKAAFDDRQRTHVRRDLLQKIQDNIKARSSSTLLTSSAARSRLLIHGVSALLLVLSAVGAILAGRVLYHAAGQLPFDWRVVPPFSAAALLFVFTLIFYFKWTSRWADRLAHQDLSVAQYASDILRASWIAELLFEFKDEQQKELPPEVLTSLTEGLFKREEFSTGRYHPSDELGAMVRRVKSFKAGPQGVEITAGKP